MLGRRAPGLRATSDRAGAETRQTGWTKLLDPVSFQRVLSGRTVAFDHAFLWCGPTHGRRPIRQALKAISIRTRGRGPHEVTAVLGAFVRDSGIAIGLLTVWCRHTSASLLVMENASPEVMEDVEDWMGLLAPESPARYRHSLEGADDMPAHLRTALTGVQLTIPVDGGATLLGTWQGVFLWEHRARPHDREIALHLIGA